MREDPETEALTPGEHYETLTLALALVIDALDEGSRGRLEARLAALRRRLEAERPRHGLKWADQDWAMVSRAEQILRDGLEGARLPE